MGLSLLNVLNYNKTVDNTGVFTLNRAKTQGQTNNEGTGRMTDDWAKCVYSPSLKKQR